MSLKHPLISMRLLDHHLNPRLLDEHLSLMQWMRAEHDEVWFASDYGFPSLSVHQDHAQRMAEAAAKVRALGIGASLQISNTIGHGDAHRFLDFSALASRMMGCDGTIAPYCACPRDPAFHIYLETLTRAYCAWQPDRVWIDDDLRMNNHSPVAFGCFCDRCLAEFSRTTGRDSQREELGRAINEDNDLVTRAAWLHFCRTSAAGVARTVGQAAVAVAPECQLCLQHGDLCWGGYNGPDWSHVFQALRDVSGRPVGSRPGEAFYNDHQPRGMIGKALMTGAQNARLPDCVERVSYECENLPGSLIGKSAQGTALECTLAIAQGCNSLSFTHLMFPHEFAWHGTMMAKLSAWRPFWARYVDANEGTFSAGVEIVFSQRHAMRETTREDGAFAWASTGFGDASLAAVLGLPLCWNPQAPAAWLTASAAHGVDAADLKRLRARGLIVDGTAGEILEQRGLASVLGLRFRQTTAPFVCLGLTDDALNGPFAGQTLTCASYMFGTPRLFEVTEGVTRCLSLYADAQGRVAEPETVAVEHSDGSRVVVFGWNLGHATMPTARRHQILAAANWVGQRRLPVWLETPCQVMVVPRCDSRGQVVTVLLVNVSLDPTPELKLTLGDSSGEGAWTWLRPPSGERLLKGGTTLTLPPLEAWECGVLVRNTQPCGRLTP